jgi:hypothetical protein
MPWSANDAERHAQGNNVGAEGTLGKNRQRMLGTNRRRRPRYTGSCAALTVLFAETEKKPACFLISSNCFAVFLGLSI